MVRHGEASRSRVGTEGLRVLLSSCLVPSNSATSEASPWLLSGPCTLSLSKLVSQTLHRLDAIPGGFLGVWRFLVFGCPDLQPCWGGG